MKPGGGGGSDQSSLVLQLTNNASAAASNFGPRSTGGGTGTAGGGRVAPSGGPTAARHKLPVSPSGPRFLPARNISALARTLPKIINTAHNNVPENNNDGGDDYGESVVERRPSFNKNLSTSYQIFLLDHNYSAPPFPPQQHHLASNSSPSVPVPGLKASGSPNALTSAASNSLLLNSVLSGGSLLNGVNSRSHHGQPLHSQGAHYEQRVIGAPASSMQPVHQQQFVNSNSHQMNRYSRNNSMNSPREQARSRSPQRSSQPIQNVYYQQSSPVGNVHNARRENSGGVGPGHLSHSIGHRLSPAPLPAMLPSAMGGSGRGGGLPPVSTQPDDSDISSSDDERKPSKSDLGYRLGPGGSQMSPQKTAVGSTLPDDGEETETAPEDEDSVTRCICEFQHDDGYMICCDKCLVWQHVDCMGLERGNIPDEYRCEECEPRRVNKARAIQIQLAKRAQFNDSDSIDSRGNTGNAKSGGGRKKKTSTRGAGGRKTERKLASGGSRGAWRSTDNKKNKIKGKAQKRRTTTKRSTKATEKKDVKCSVVSPPDVSSPPPPMSGNSLNALRQWVDSYEEAVTNHYSPELRARVAAIRVSNGVNSELRMPSNLSTSPKCKISMLPSGLKILVASASLNQNQAIIEIRGKYMLIKGGNLSSVPKGSPHVFHHRIGSPQDAPTDVCVDASTYGNDARFVRRSCKPNAEIRHCIEKGTLHLYIVSTTTIEAKGEITIPVKSGQFCVCGNGEKCTVQLNNTTSGANDKRRQRGRRRTVSESSTGPGSISALGVAATAVVKHSLSPPASPLAATGPASPPLASTAAPSADDNKPTSEELVTALAAHNNNNINTESVDMKADMKPIIKRPTTPVGTGSNGPLPSSSSSGGEDTPVKTVKIEEPPSSSSKIRGQAVAARRATTPASKQEEKKRGSSSRSQLGTPSKKPDNSNSGKMTREERKLEAWMKAFERMEKDEARRQAGVNGAVSSVGNVNGGGGGVSGSRSRKSSLSASPVRSRIERTNNRKNRNSRTLRETRSTKALRSRRAANSLLNESSSRGAKNARSGASVNSRNHKNMASTRRAAQSRVTHPSESSPEDDDGEEVEEDPDTDSDDEKLTPPRITRTRSENARKINGPHASSSKLDVSEPGNSPPGSPFDKATVLDGLTPNKSILESDLGTPPPAMSNACLLVAAAVGPLAPGFKFPKSKDPKKNLMSSWFGNESNGPHSPPKAGGGGTPVVSDFAKKRWLRQAISEDSDSPKQSESVSPTSEMAAPPKKRRIARESISSELSFTPPATPQANDNSGQAFEDEESVSSPPLPAQSVQQTPVPARPSTPQCPAEETPEMQLAAMMSNGPHTPPPPSETTPVRRLSARDRENMPSVVDILSAPEEPEPLESVDASPKPITETAEEKMARVKEEARVKRKLSISEYRERVKKGSGKGENSNSSLENNQATSNGPSSSADSVSSPEATEDESDDADRFVVPPLVPLTGISSTTVNTAALTSLSGASSEAAFKKGVVSGFNAAPTLVEQQREALTDRLRREFGLFLSDDDEEKNKRSLAAAAAAAAAGNIPELVPLTPPLPPPPPPRGDPPPPPLPPNPSSSIAAARALRAQMQLQPSAVILPPNLTATLPPRPSPNWLYYAAAPPPPPPPPPPTLLPPPPPPPPPTPSSSTRSLTVHAQRQ